ncbi:hypothetical protein J8C02_08855 [Chloracidobacterium sp. MS 40/45]|jgi:hypothetical protein|uniref:hypothetical protein n=1 Tax=Chloracidobacterium aggregatum TaxID=2851959 RepID=UPI001B8B96A1|nr:hypothetical protein [Chloracidobacterium aggregatum]QUV99523.1 hypothetical protein J8C02_08855 [Chloracidobacterium sp. MS 40/45]
MVVTAPDHFHEVPQSVPKPIFFGVRVDGDGCHRFFALCFRWCGMLAGGMPAFWMSFLLIALVHTGSLASAYLCLAGDMRHVWRRGFWMGLTIGDFHLERSTRFGIMPRVFREKVTSLSKLFAHT